MWLVASVARPWNLWANGIPRAYVAKPHGLDYPRLDPRPHATRQKGPASIDVLQMGMPHGGREAYQVNREAQPCKGAIYQPRAAPWVLCAHSNAA